MAARDLGLRPDQVEDARNLKALRVEEIAEGGHVRQAVREGEAATSRPTNGDTFEKMAEMLTRAQRERLKEMRGKPFEGKADLVAPTAEPPPPQYSATNVGFYDLELLYSPTPALMAELKLTDAQVRALSAAWNEATGDYGPVHGRLRHGWVDAVLMRQTEKALDKQLTKEAGAGSNDERHPPRKSRLGEHCNDAREQTYPPN